MHSVYACHAHFAIALLLWKPVLNLTETIKLIILSWFSFSSDYPFGLIHLLERINLIRHTLRYSDKKLISGMLNRGMWCLYALIEAQFKKGLRELSHSWSPDSGLIFSVVQDSGSAHTRVSFSCGLGPHCFTSVSFLKFGICFFGLMLMLCFLQKELPC